MRSKILAKFQKKVFDQQIKAKIKSKADLSISC
jgi:hypothetical protein